MADPTPQSEPAVSAPTAADEAKAAKGEAKPKAKAAKGVLAKPIHHNGARIEAGEPAPSDLTSDQIDRFKSLGVIET